MEESKNMFSNYSISNYLKTMNQQSQYLLQVAVNPNTTWNDKVSQVSQAFGVNAAQAAQILDPYYKSIQDLTWMLAVLMKPEVGVFVNQMADLVHHNQMKWSDAVGHVARQLQIGADKAAVLLSNSMKSRY